MDKDPPADFIVNGLEKFPHKDTPVHLAIGMFDGLHRGHQEVFSAALEARAEAGGKAGVLTFNPHPSHLFRPQSPTPQIYPATVKARLLARRGFDFTIVEPFSGQLAALSAEDFWGYLRKNLPSLRTVCVGANFRFGHRRSGAAEDLQTFACRDQLNCRVRARLESDGEAISSSRIRSLLPQAPIAAVNALLGYPYTVFSQIEAGKKLGREIGFPTMNFPWSPEIQPPFGVYRVQVRLGGSDNFLPGVANYGLRPTVNPDEQQPLLEVHVLRPFKSIAGGTHGEIQLLDFLRPEKRFATLDALQKAIANDVREACRAFAQNGVSTG